MTAAEKLRAEGREEGREQGRVEGRVEGREQGRMEGCERGKALLLLRLLAFRFGPLAPELEARVAEASPATVERWAERVLGAASIDDVFR